MENWRELEPTEKQMNLIRDIDRFLPNSFSGSTRGDASDYINKNKGAIELAYSSEWALTHGYL